MIDPDELKAERADVLALLEERAEMYRRWHERGWRAEEGKTLGQMLLGEVVVLHGIIERGEHRRKEEP